MSRDQNAERSHNMKTDNVSFERLKKKYGERKGVYRVLVGKLERKRLLWRPRHRWEDNIKMDLQEVRFGGMGWIDLAEDRNRWRPLVNAVKNIRVP